MKIRNLIDEWELAASGRLSRVTYHIPLDLESAARLAALAEMYPRRHAEELLGELVSAALQELEASLPYVRGSTVVAHDEQGDPVYEDIGPTPRFLALTHKHMQELQRSDDDDF